MLLKQPTSLLFFGLRHRGIRTGSSPRLNVLAEPKIGVSIGDTIGLDFDMNHAQFFDRDSGKSLLWSQTDAS